MRIGNRGTPRRVKVNNPYGKLAMAVLEQTEKDVKGESADTAAYSAEAREFLLSGQYRGFAALAGYGSAEAEDLVREVLK